VTKKKRSEKDQWYEVVAHSDDMVNDAVELDKTRFAVKGPVEGCLVVVLPREQMHVLSISGAMDRVTNGITDTFRKEGFEGGIIFAPDDLRFMKLKPTSAAQAKLLEQRMKRMEAEAANEVERATEGEPLTEDTETAGEA